MYDEGDRVRIDIPDTDDPDFRYHRQQGEIVEVIKDEASSTSGDERDNEIYRVELDSGEVIDFRWRDLRPPT